MIWPATSPELVAAVSEAGGVGTIAGIFSSGDALGWKRRITEAESEDVVRFETWSAIMPPRPPGAYDVVPRVMRTEFVSEWESRPGDAASSRSG